MTVSERLLLGNEPKSTGMIAGNFRERRLVLRTEDNAELLDACPQGFFDEDAKDGFLPAVPVDEGLERKCLLSSSCRSNHGLGDSHVSPSFFHEDFAWIKDPVRIEDALDLPHEIHLHRGNGDGEVRFLRVADAVLTGNGAAK
jgi:hypothetical protein